MPFFLPAGLALSLFTLALGMQPFQSLRSTVSGALNQKNKTHCYWCSTAKKKCSFYNHDAGERCGRCHHLDLVCGPRKTKAAHTDDGPPPKPHKFSETVRARAPASSGPSNRPATSHPELARPPLPSTPVRPDPRRLGNDLSPLTGAAPYSINSATTAHPAYQNSIGRLRPEDGALHHNNGFEESGKRVEVKSW